MPAKSSARRARREPNHLHRVTERWEDVLSLLLGVLLVTAGGIGFWTGGSVYDLVAERARTELADLTPVAGILLQDTVPVTGASRPSPRKASVRWVGDDGAEHTATTTIPGVHRAGETVPLWADRTGRLVQAPKAASDATLAALLVGLLIGTGGAGVVYLIGRLLFAWTARRFASAWEQEWERVGPEWTGRARF